MKQLYQEYKESQMGRFTKKDAASPRRLNVVLSITKNNSLGWRPHTHKYSLKVPPPFMTMTPTVYLVNMMAIR
jgi:hypothetical protein